jgi:hypothetical protein
MLEYHLLIVVLIFIAIIYITLAYLKNQILCGQALRLSELDHLEELVDKNLRQITPKDEITSMINLGLSCQQFSASDRPTMSDVVAMILGNKQINNNFKFDSSTDYGFSLSEAGVSAYVSSVAPISEET